MKKNPHRILCWDDKFIEKNENIQIQAHKPEKKNIAKQSNLMYSVQQTKVSPEKREVETMREEALWIAICPQIQIQNSYFLQAVFLYNKHQKRL